jgi:hypothetical protein
VTDKDPHLLGPGLAATPFTADEIRLACPAGRLVTSHAESADGTVLRVTNRYLSCDAEGAEIERTEHAPDGSVVDRDAGRSTWLELQQHAAFPEDRTTIERTVLDGPLGPQDCLLYTVSAGPVVRRFWFATARPGMPVRVETVLDGVVTQTRHVVSYDLLAD